MEDYKVGDFLLVNKSIFCLPYMKGDILKVIEFAEDPGECRTEETRILKCCGVNDAIIKLQRVHRAAGPEPLDDKGRPYLSFCYANKWLSVKPFTSKIEYEYR